jgi:hypothetical protein
MQYQDDNFTVKIHFRRGKIKGKLEGEVMTRVMMPGIREKSHGTTVAEHVIGVLST